MYVVEIQLTIFLPCIGYKALFTTFLKLRKEASLVRIRRC